ncbi:hypothetical protein FOA52_003829 [Chlamydomonas sp. UWO 241]|nr:hypothetical protein FOA52_003829 [Chlamydomonas sp. UWO 241]
MGGVVVATTPSGGVPKGGGRVGPKTDGLPQARNSGVKKPTKRAQQQAQGQQQASSGVPAACMALVSDMGGDMSHGAHGGVKKKKRALKEKRPLAASATTAEVPGASTPTEEPQQPKEGQEQAPAAALQQQPKKKKQQAMASPIADTPGLPKFADMAEISPQTLDVLTALGFERMTPVQEATIPLFCGNKDVAVDACTGSGKTLAFVIPVVERLRRMSEPLKKHQVGAVIISPTRELARQIAAVAEPFLASVPLAGAGSLLLVGGTDPAEDVARFKASGAAVLIGTPGRIDDVMKRCALMDLRQLEVLVLDEADRLLDMGFKAQLDAIMARLPRQRRTGLFSATQTEAVEALARAGLRNPVRVAVAVAAKAQGGKGGADAGASTQVTPSSLQIQYAVCGADEKMEALVAFLRAHSTQKVIVYFLTCSLVDYVHVALKRLGHKLLPGLQVRALHGRMKQAQRESTLTDYTALHSGALLCTDLAARGLDIPDVSWILQFDPPQDPAQFVHRVGRTARMGRQGNALVLLMPHEVSYIEFLRLRKVPVAEVPSDVPAPSGGGGGGSGQPPEVLPLLRGAAEGDREVMEAGLKAFVSYVRGYKEHHCKYIFRLQDLSLGRLATAMGLLRLPAMPELKKGAGSIEGFTPSSVDPASVRFKDKTREKQHQASLKKATAKAEAERAQRGVAKAKRIKDQALDQATGNRLTATKRRQLQQRDELAELETEYRLLKKLKRGKISGHEFDVATGLSDESDGEDDGGGDAGGGGGGGKPGGGKAKAGGGSGAGGQGGAGTALGRKTAEYLEAKRKRKKRRGGGQAGGPVGGN